MTADHSHKPPAPNGTTAPQTTDRGQQRRAMTDTNKELAAERDALKQKLSECSRLLQASSSGLIALDKAGLIDGINPRAVEMLGAEKSFVLHKPISMFIAPEDQSVFYINRSKVFAGDQREPFEINLKRQDGTIWSARVNARPFHTPDQRLPGMLLSFEDISAYRQALESLQFQEDFVNLLVTILDDLAAWSTTDIDDVIVYSLEKVGLVSGADRVYVCLFHDRRTRLTITHEWLGDAVDSPADRLNGAALGAFSAMLNQAKKGNTVAVADIETLPADLRSIQEHFHAPGVKAMLYTPLFYGRYLLGIIGCDAVKHRVTWSREAEHLVRCVGGAIVNALLRKQTERAPAKIRETILRFVAPEAVDETEEPFEYEGPIEVMDNEPAAAPADEPRWHVEAGEPDDPSLMGTARLKDGTTANVACQNCNRQKQIDLSDIRTLGTRLKVTCICGNILFFKVELRREHRKKVRLEGIFIRGPGDRIAPKSDDWGRIVIDNLSRNGIGFTIFDKQDIRVEDRFRVKFNLDNTARSTVQKEVIVRSVANDVIGCEFTGKDPSDVTLGFYMMT